MVKIQSAGDKHKTSWGKEANWYDNYLNDDDSYQKQVIMPNLLRIVSPKKGMKILDLACGQGIFSEMIIDAGANVLSADISEELIGIAKKRLANKISAKDSFMVARAGHLLDAGVAQGSCDSAICVLAAQNIKEFDLAIKEVSKIIKSGGKFTIVLNHPCFRIPKYSDWHFDEKGGGQEGDLST